VVDNCKFYNNTATGGTFGLGAGISASFTNSESFLVVQNSEFIGNAITDPGFNGGTAIFVKLAGLVKIENNVFRNNSFQSNSNGGQSGNWVSISNK
jgi:hypothetical protein